MKTVLQLDGGGILGAITAAFLVHLETDTGLKCHEMFDLISGTSTGSIIGGYLSVGVSATEIFEMYMKHGRNIFKRRGRYNPFNVMKPMYNREDVVKAMADIGDGYSLSDCLTKFMSVSVMVSTGLPVFAKSWNYKYSDLKLIDVINRSYAAPLYFGRYEDVYGNEWLDGGTGSSNCTLGYSISEMMRLGWYNEGYILSIGTGRKMYRPSYTGIDFIDDILNVLSIARRQSTSDQEYFAKVMNECDLSAKVNRIYPDIFYELDDVEHIDTYWSLGSDIYDWNKDELLRELANHEN